MNCFCGMFAQAQQLVRRERTTNPLVPRLTGLADKRNFRIVYILANRILRRVRDFGQLPDLPSKPQAYFRNKGAPGTISQAPRGRFLRPPDL